MYDIFSNEKKEIQPHQREAVDGIRILFDSSDNLKNALLYHSMGTGKTLTAVQASKNATDGDNHCNLVLVVAPPSTHREWELYMGRYLSVPFKCVSHQWVTRNAALAATMITARTLLVVDELHISCNRGKAGTVALTRFIRRAFGAILMSGTPFRNKEDRLFTVHDWLFADAGNYEKWLHSFCNTEPDRFSYYPKFVSFKAGEIEDYLKGIDRFPWKKIFLEVRKMDYVTTNECLPITSAQYRILEAYSVYGTEDFAVVNSVMRKNRYLSYLKYCDAIEVDRENDSCTLLRPRKDVVAIIEKYAHRNPIVYSQSSKVASLYGALFWDSLYVDGKTAKKEKERILAKYKEGGMMLFATDSVSTGTDGIQDATDCIVILYDTDDGTSRDQLIGRIAGGFRNSGSAEIVFVTIG